MKIGWIGLGEMGQPMALRALGQGHEVIGHTRSQGRPSRLVDAGGTLSSSVEEIASTADILFLCLFDDTQLQDVLLSQGGLSALREGTPVVVHTTGDPTVLEELAATTPGGNLILDAPFSGTSSMAGEGNITLLTGGDPKMLEIARPVLQSYCSKIIHLGAVGAARRLKLLNNLLFAAQTTLASEALLAAKEMGMNMTSVAQAINCCSGASYAMAKFAGTTPMDSILDTIKPYLDKDVDVARSAMSREKVELPIIFSAAKWGRH